ncbi:MAG: Gfo/Idh/MocA family oxidoreductase [Myxococcales bacterium]|nr:Gfo/Idh/MocA family oxidoreductase [Myxococcales bacterium]MCB9525248.1 Gfo/Idh/MocA family oxidoreductase [Myxococcales bacterium]
MKRFAMLGAAGYVAPRHMRAIHDTGHQLVAACDPYDGVGILDRYFPDCRFFTEVERFDRHLEKMRRRDGGVDYVSICSPNYLHDAHCRLAMRVHADAICEKPLVLSPWNIDQLAELEDEFGKKIYTVLQLRLHDEVQRLKAQIEQTPAGQKHELTLTYITRRGPWYHHSWKGDPAKSGSLAANIGIHFFDMLLWLFGGVEASKVHVRADDRVAGVLELERARVRWFLSVNVNDLPDGWLASGKHAYRGLSMGDLGEFDFSTGFDDLHTKVYEDVLGGGGYGLADARPSIELVHGIRVAELSSPGQGAHPFILG